MTTENIFPLVVYPETKRIQIIFIIFILIFGVISFLMNSTLILFLPIVFLIYETVMNIYKKYKIKELQANGKKIKISRDGIALIEINDVKKIYTWEDINDVEFNIKAFDETSVISGNRGYTGNENFITLNTKSNEQIIFNFYIKNKENFEKLARDLKNDVFPIAYSLQKIKNENLYFGNLNYNEKQLFKEKYNISHYSGKMHYK
jgi:hypothetical protein